MHPDPMTSTEKEEHIEPSIDECIYDKIIDVLNKRFNPSQLDQFTKKLQSHTYATIPSSGRTLYTTVPPMEKSSCLPRQATPFNNFLATTEIEIPQLPPKPPKKQFEESLVVTDTTSLSTKPATSMMFLTVDPGPPTLNKTKRSMSVPEVVPLVTDEIPAEEPVPPREPPESEESYEDMDSGQSSTDHSGSRCEASQLSPRFLPLPRPKSEFALTIMQGLLFGSIEE